MEDYECGSAVREDLAGVYRIEREVFGDDAWDPLSIAFFLYLDLAAFTVCRSGGEVVGYAIGVLEKDKGHLLNIAVSKAYQGRGLGKVLLSLVEEEMRKRGARMMYLEVRKDNIRAIEFYESQGYHVSGVKKEYYSDGVDALVMEKKI